MKLGVSINYWDCGELLEGCVRSILPFADHISIIFQKYSNYGVEMHPADHAALVSIDRKKLVPHENIIRLERPKDDLTAEGGVIIGGIHESRKRNYGLLMARKAGCTHFMSMDADEFYSPKQFLYMMAVMEQGDFDVALCQMQTYYKEPIYRITPPEDYFVPVIYKIKPETRFVLLGVDAYPVMVDPTRRSLVDTPLLLTRDEIEMHHMSYVRKDISRKLSNSSAHINHDPDDLAKCINWYNNWRFPQKAILIGKGISYHTVVQSTDFLAEFFPQQ